MIRQLVRSLTAGLLLVLLAVPSAHGADEDTPASGSCLGGAFMAECPEGFEVAISIETPLPAPGESGPVTFRIDNTGEIDVIFGGIQLVSSDGETLPADTPSGICDVSDPEISVGESVLARCEVVTAADVECDVTVALIATLVTGVPAEGDEHYWGARFLGDFEGVGLCAPRTHTVERVRLGGVPSAWLAAIAVAAVAAALIVLRREPH